MCIRDSKSLIGRSEKQIATAKALGLKKAGDVTTQPDNAATHGKINRISHMVEAVSYTHLIGDCLFIPDGA